MLQVISTRIVQVIWRCAVLFVILAASCSIADVSWFWDGIFEAAKALLTVWWLFPLMLLPIIPELALKLWQIHMYSKAGLPEIDHMTGRQFEEWLATFFKGRGYDVTLTPEQGDYGADLVLRKGSVKTVVQAKRWKGNVGVSAVQEITAARGYYRADNAMVVTNSFFTKEATELAKRNHVVLWNRNKLKDEILAEQAKRTTANNQPFAGRVSAVKAAEESMGRSQVPWDAHQQAPGQGTRRSVPWGRAKLPRRDASGR